ncbi:peptidase domain-containing ABC transporter [Phaeodactylibacter luteus]|uniref:Peptidase domain-containing ABC transporter n=1 Tax=Phaeodactylibacter luteus TaxID=1564516 RepID=A0A5C6RU68_9BACT|nr:peptidase domain-containing ABC transporter [Phaeodactylibacter luteus]TXB65559.1 peptidase domain-containing ABC transporter [Phaeodactylibacter luteus]
MPKRFPFDAQHDAMDCGPACLRMVARHYGKAYPLPYLREQTGVDREGSALQGLVYAAEKMGFQALPALLPLTGAAEQPGLEDAPLPLIVHWEQRHFVVVYQIGRNTVRIADPALGLRRLSKADFLNAYEQKGASGIALLLEPQPAFYEQEPPQPGGEGSARYLWAHLRPYRHYIGQLALGLLLASIVQLAFPLLTQAIVDIGIRNADLGFIRLALLAQLSLFAGRATIRILQNRILLHLGTRVNVSLIADFLQRLLSLPLSFLDTRQTGDLLQRIGDHRRIEQFLAQSSLSFLFSVFSLLVFGGILAFYHVGLFLVFLLSSTAYLGWVALFLGRRRAVDHMRFREGANSQNRLIEIIQGMAEIKLQGSGQKRRWQWMEVQAQLFRANLKALNIEEAQDNGAAVISQLKDILITVLSAQLVIEGQITLGMMLAVQFILGQANLPLSRLVSFARQWQDAKLSFARLADVHHAAPEQSASPGLPLRAGAQAIKLEGVSFRYSALSPLALREVSLAIPAGKVTAIVGRSGSGKTTLLKLLLSFYEPEQGQIFVGGQPLAQLDKAAWRSRCGAVLQDGFVFSDTLANNIAESSTAPDPHQLEKAIRMAGLEEDLQDLPLGLQTKVGGQGSGISQGQRQRLLLARAVYKSPDYLFLDEATNALDANTERIINRNLAAFQSGRTTVVIAHRLSTVRQADQIVVLEKGQIVEQGSHAALINARGAYFQLIRNQLELGE